MPMILSSFFKSKPSPPLRIADVLLLQDHQEEALLHNLTDGCKRLNCSTPHGMAARLLSALKLGKVKKIVADNGDRQKQDDDVAPTYVTSGPDSSSERCKREADRCLLHLIAESKDELQKMKDLRIQMESVLQNVKAGLPNVNLLDAKKLESNDRVEEGLGFNTNLRPNKLLFDQSLTCDDVPIEEDRLEGRDILEAELEVELERLQLHLDAVELSTNPPQEATEDSPVNSSISTRSYSISCAEVVDPTIDDGEEEVCMDTYYEVPPYELGRKLHELLETRQEEQIRELEAALEFATQELLEKEREISWWKDTAHLIIRHVKEPSRLDFQHAQHTHHLI
ncbi:hypothetical protein PTKIN_Ptkin03bG0177600 [Pterospermum kingtungense]